MGPVDWLPMWVAYPLFWITQHQTLLAGFAAVLVGALTIHAIRDQIAQVQRLETDKLKRRHFATIAGLPNSCVEIIDYADACWKSWITILERWEEYENRDDDSFRILDTDVLDFPHDAFRQVRLAIETAPTAEAATMADMLAFGQIHLSRYRSLMDQFDSRTHDAAFVTHKTNVYRAARDSLELRFRASRILNYARRDRDVIDPLPGFDAVEDFLFFLSPTIEEELRTYLRRCWHQHWSSSATSC